MACASPKWRGWETTTSTSTASPTVPPRPRRSGGPALRPPLWCGGGWLDLRLPRPAGDFAMEMYNADGSGGPCAATASAAWASILYDKGLTCRTSLQVDTDSGLRALRLLPAPPASDRWRWTWGSPFRLSPQISIPLMELTYPSCPSLWATPTASSSAPTRRSRPGRAGPRPERHPVFPDRTNVEFVAVEGDQLRLRGGSGAAARLWPAAPAPAPPWLPPTSWDCAPRGHRPSPRRLLVLSLDTASGHIRMTGPAVTVFEGEWPGG